VRRLSELGSDRRGATAVEYGLIMALIFLAMIAGVRAFASGAIEMWTHVADKVSG
jgi:pilus assembly protein Flp/PilA